MTGNRTTCTWGRLLVILACIGGPAVPLGAQVRTDTSTARDRAAFDFLVGTWTVVSRTDAKGDAPLADETYTFSKGLNGVMIAGNWRFNRGTPTAPDYADAVYYSGYDTRTRAWSFYYISPQSAQYWPGAATDGRWVFTRPFTLGDTAFIQRQWWERIDERTIDRHIDNSPDNGKTWRPFTVRMTRRP